MKHDIRQVSAEEIQPYVEQGKREGLLFLPNTEYSMVYVDGVAAGFGGLRTKQRQATFRNLYVFDEYRGQGLGIMLIRYRITRSRELGMTKAIAYTNWNSLPVYLKCGATLLNDKRYYGRVVFNLLDRFRVRGL